MGTAAATASSPSATSERRLPWALGPPLVPLFLARIPQIVQAQQTTKCDRLGIGILFGLLLYDFRLAVLMWRRCNRKVLRHVKLALCHNILLDPFAFCFDERKVVLLALVCWCLCCWIANAQVFVENASDSKPLGVVLQAISGLLGVTLSF